MAVTIADVERIAALARLSFTEAEKERLAEELSEILRSMEHLNALDTTGVEPLAQVVGTGTVLRDDRRRESLTQEEALANAPSRRDGFFSVPKVIGDR